MEYRLNEDQIFKIVFKYKTGTPASEMYWPEIKLSTTREGHAQQVRRLTEYVLSNHPEYSGIKLPTQWFYMKAFHAFGFYDLTDASTVTKQNFVNVEEVCHFMFKNKYISKVDFLNKNLF